LVDSQKRNKLESKSKRCYFIGFTKGTNANRLWDPEKKSVFVSRDVVFDKKSMLQEKSKRSIRHKVELQTVQQILRAMSLSFQMIPTSMWVI